MSDTLKEIADNLGVTTINGSYLSGIADYYGVDLATSTDLMKDILTAVGGDPSTSTDYLQDIVLALGGTVTINGNWMEAWEAITAVSPAPVNSTLPVISGTTTIGSVLSTTNGTWTNSPTSFTYQWKRGATNIGTNANTYTLVAADSTAAITCVVTAINASGSTPATSNTITADNYAPVNSVAPVNSGSDYVTSVLTTTNGTWSNSPTSFTYQWYRNTTLISGETSSSYTLVQADADFEVKCKVTAINASGSGVADSNLIYIYDYDYNQVYTSGYGVAPSLAYSKLQNKLLVDLKTAGVWAKLDSLFVFANDGDFDFASVDWKLLQQGTNNSTTYSQNQGITADSTLNAYFDTNFNPFTAGTNYTQNNASRYAYVKNFGDAPNSLTIIDGVSASGVNSIQIGSFIAQTINQTVGLSNPFDYDTTAKMKSIHRTSATSVTLFNDTTSTTEVVTSATIANNNQLIFRKSAIYSDGGTIGLYAMGSSMISENTDFVNAVNTYMNSI